MHGLAGKNINLIRELQLGLEQFPLHMTTPTGTIAMHSHITPDRGWEGISGKGKDLMDPDGHEEKSPAGAKWLMPKRDISLIYRGHVSLMPVVGSVPLAQHWGTQFFINPPKNVTCTTVDSFHPIHTIPISKTIPDIKRKDTMGRPAAYSLTPARIDAIYTFGYKAFLGMQANEEIKVTLWQYQLPKDCRTATGTIPPCSRLVRTAVPTAVSKDTLKDIVKLKNLMPNNDTESEVDRLAKQNLLQEWPCKHLST